MPEGLRVKSVGETRRMLEKEKKKNVREKECVSKREVQENMCVR